MVATRLRSWFDKPLGLHHFGFRRVEEVATSTGEGEGVELSFHDIERPIHVFVVVLFGTCFLDGAAIHLC